MAINENTGPELEEYQQQPPLTLTRRIPSNSTTVSASSNVYQRRNQQEESNSPSDFTCNDIDSPSDFINDINHPSVSISLSNEGNQSLSISVVKTVVDTVEEYKSVKEDGELKVKEEITSEVEVKEEKSVKEEGEIDNKDYSQAEDNKSNKSYVSLSLNNREDHTSLNNGEDPTMTLSSRSSSSHQSSLGRRGR